MKRFAWACMIGVTCIAALVPLRAHSQDYPSKPIQIVVPFAVGGSSDIVARLIARKIESTMGQPVTIRNIPGAGGAVGSQAVARSAPDGHTVLFTTTNSLFASTIPNLPFDPKRDLTLVTSVAEPVFGLFVNPSVPANSVQELVEYAKRNPKKLSFASTGAGGAAHLLNDAFQRSTGAEIADVPYTGTSPAISALTAGLASMLFAPIEMMRSRMPSLNLKLLAVTGPERYPALPDVPNVREVVPGFEPPSLAYAFFVPAGTPQPVLVRLNSEISKTDNTTDLRERLLDLGLVPVSSEQLARVVANQAKAQAAERAENVRRSQNLSASARDGATKLFNQAFELFKAGEFDAAVRGFTQGLEIDPANGVAHFYLAETYARQNKTALARTHYQRTVDFAPDSKEALLAQSRLKK
ncbi:MAG: tetratricopeptide repeat protein [Candidatus Tectomicrobia bacterium]|uniref:Tetratricopeptide repeat protein n=1 Tax=Tectimicrobiota bacterium TaxID=2528274 RepID=A0A932GMM8_UNCTE|nr:tetratricopeptide repeat protein [Candidatus Tectomicrobia bacterium]